MGVCVQGVAKNFREIFSELVPGGKGELVMQRRAPVPTVDAADEEDEEAAEQQNASEKYSGVKVKVCVSFVQGVDVMQLIQSSRSLSRPL